MIEFGLVVRELRHKKGLTLLQLAHEVGLKHAPYICHVENHNEIPSPEMVVKLAQALGADVRNLISLARLAKIATATRDINRKYDKVFDRRLMP